MSGVEVAALVAAIISAFTGTASYLKERQKRKRDKARQGMDDLDRLRRAVIEAPPVIQQEYDYDFARTGPAFAAGDKISREQLTRVLINMQQNIINQLQILLLHPSSSRTPQLSSLVDISHQSRLDSIDALSQQYQRFQVAAPIPRDWMGSESMPAIYSSPRARNQLPETTKCTKKKTREAESPFWTWASQVKKKPKQRLLHEAEPILEQELDALAHRGKRTRKQESSRHAKPAPVLGPKPLSKKTLKDVPSSIWAYCPASESSISLVAHDGSTR